MFNFIKKYLKQRKCEHDFIFFCGFEVEYYQKGYGYCGGLTWIPYHGYYKEEHCKHCGKSIYLEPISGEWRNGTDKKYWLKKTTWFFAEGNLD